MAVDDNISLNRIFDVIDEIATRHEMIEDNEVGDLASRGSSKGQEEGSTPRELKFPYLFTDIASVGYEVGQGLNVAAKIYRITLFVADKHLDSAENDQDILSDTESILSDVVMYLVSHPDLRSYIIGTGVSEATPARHTTIQEAFGFQVTVAIRVPAAKCWELLPFDNGSC